MKFSYNDVDLAIKTAESSLAKYQAIANKTPGAKARIENYKQVIKELKAMKKATKPKTKRKVSQNSLNVLKALNRTADQLQRNAGTTEKTITIKVQKLKRKDALKQAAKLYKR